MGIQRFEFLAARRVPQLEAPIPSPRHDTLVIWRKFAAVHFALVPAQNVQLGSGFRVPDLDGVVPRTRDHPLAVMREPADWYGITMPRKGAQFIPGNGIPQIDFTA